MPTPTVRPRAAAAADQLARCEQPARRGARAADDGGGGGGAGGRPAGPGLGCRGPGGRSAARCPQGGPRAAARRGAPAHPVVARPVGLGPRLRFDIASRTAPRSPARETRRPCSGCAASSTAPASTPRAAPRTLGHQRPRRRGLALLFRLHHVMADGAAALALLGALFDPRPAAVRMPGGRPPGIPHLAFRCRRQGNCSSTICTDTHRDPAHGRAAGLALRPASLGRRMRATVGLARLLLAGGRAPALSFNRPVTTERRLTLVRADPRRRRQPPTCTAQRSTTCCWPLSGTAPAPCSRLAASSSRDWRCTCLSRRHCAQRERLAPRAEWRCGRCWSRLTSWPALAPATRTRQAPGPEVDSPHHAATAAGEPARQQRRRPRRPLWFGGARVPWTGSGNLSITVGALSYSGQLNVDIGCRARARHRGVRRGCGPRAGGARVPPRRDGPDWGATAPGRPRL